MTNYSKTRVLTDSTLAKNRERCRRAMGLCLVGARQRAERGTPATLGVGSGSGALGLPAEERARLQHRLRPCRRNPFALDEAEEVGEGSHGYSSGEEEDEEEEEEEAEGAEQLLGGGGGEEDGGRMELLYALTERNTEGKIRNLLQISAGILSWSKVIFFHKINWILTVADPDKAELMYCGE